MDDDAKTREQLLDEVRSLRRRLRQLESRYTEPKRQANTPTSGWQRLQGALDGLSAHVAILDHSGTILAVNEAWYRFAEANRYHDPSYGVGANYLRVCYAARGPDRSTALAAASGIRSVMSGQRQEFQLEYPCHAPGRPLWFMLRAARFTSDGKSYIAVAHENTTRGKLAESSLQDNETLLSTIIEHVSDAIYIKDREGRYLLINPAGASLLGLDVDAMIGKRDLELFGKEVEQDVAAIDQQVMQSQQPASYEQTRTVNGEQRVFLTSKAPFFSQQGQVLGIIGTARDITARKQTEAAHHAREKMFEAIINASPDLITIVAINGRIKFSSPAIREILGYTPEERHGLNPVEFVHPEDRENIAHILNWKSSSDEQPKARYRYRHADGRWITLEGRGRVMRDAQGRPIGMVIISRDVAEQVRLEEALRQATEEAQQANAAKSQFLSRMSHELRTPLNAIIGFTQLLQMEQLTTEQSESVEYIHKSGEHLLGLINEVLDIARIEVGRIALSLEPVTLRESIEEILGLVQQMADERSIRLPALAEINCDLAVQADRQRLNQIILNLVANGIKYNHEGGRVLIECAAADNDRVQIKVTDTGAGIAPDNIQQLFVPFERLGAERKGVEGTGLGLTLSRALAEAMGGAITVESTPGEGTTFMVELPRVRQRPEQQQRGEQDGEHKLHTETRHTVLYVEDNLSNMALVERILQRRSGIKLLAAMQGGMGLDLAREHQPQLILIDLHLPDMPGDELLRRLQQDTRTAGIPVVVISADAIPTQTERLLAGGARDYLTKPLDIKRFLQMLDELLPRAAS